MLRKMFYVMCILRLVLINWDHGERGSKFGFFNLENLNKVAFYKTQSTMKVPWFIESVIGKLKGIG